MLEYLCVMDFSKLRQLGQAVASRGTPPPGERLTGIVKVRAEGYTPPKLHVRARIGARMFTADFSSDDLAELRNDPLVEDVSLAERLPLQKHFG